MKTSPRSPASPSPPHRVRIIGGQWKRTPLAVPEIAGLRPTPDRVRETLFNWLGQDLAGRSCLDLFAGSGALSFEAASRGAAPVVCVERDRTACTAIRRSIEKLSADAMELHEADAERVARQFIVAKRCFDIVLLDPPFRAEWIDRMLPLAAALLAPDGDLYVEAESALDSSVVEPLGLTVRRQGSAGQVHYHVLSRAA
ncbi:MAG TPA: 16S rRNA (guanine(966)-N(2))-methyltransferase RsmD [Burkholderiaceae bacterium]|nr:16S rRNA (guanine(966)-N(2))-methyltransferase RsmD [Burkholderiaceae bacterium]